ncbi:MAG TPA: type II toxin-antitoxin system VapC family toxin [Candidatus Kapabacteria bacterium]|nr:type II toxin-antitoxin system VapC family toxin [Candidatus Kapabacteria bacterium]
MAKKYLLDGNIITEFEDRTKPSYKTIRNKLASLSDEDYVYISIISAYEYQDGIAKAPKPLSENLKNAWQTFLDLFEVLPLTLKGAAIYGEIKTLYEKHTGIGKKEVKRHTVDFILASTAIASKAIIVSDDRIFETIKNFYPSLIVENWKKT